MQQIKKVKRKRRKIKEINKHLQLKFNLILVMKIKILSKFHLLFIRIWNPVKFGILLKICQKLDMTLK